MNELALFAGAGGGLLASKWLLGWRTICYVEIEPYAVACLIARIKDGLLDDAPIWDDAKTFNGKPWRGVVDIITAGFPCQPFSVAGKRKGAKDKRNLWPDTIRIIRKVRPRYVLLENVPGLLADKYVRRIFGDLAEGGGNYRWRCLSAAEVGANHRRNRVWIVAYDSTLYGTSIERSQSDRILSEDVAHPIKGKVGNGGIAGGIADERRQTPKTRGEALRPREKAPLSGDIGQGSQDVAHAQSKRETSRKQSQDRQGNGIIESCEDVADNSGGITGKQEAGNGGEGINSGSWWSTEPRLGRVAHGVAHRVDRLKALGEGQVPEVVRVVWELLNLEKTQ